MTQDKQNKSDKKSSSKDHKPRQKDAIEFSSIGDYMKYLEEQKKQNGDK